MKTTGREPLQQKRQTMEERWAAVEIMGHRTHVGRISEEAIAGTKLLRVEALERDGSFTVRCYGAQAIFGLRDMSEFEARVEVMQKEWEPCDAFREPSALPGRCAGCGYAAPEHEAKGRKALPARSTADDEGDDEAPDSEPGEVIDVRKPIETIADFERMLSDAIEAEEFPGVARLDDVGTLRGARLLALVLDDDAETKIPITVGAWPEAETAALAEVPRG